MKVLFSVKDQNKFLINRVDSVHKKQDDLKHHLNGIQNNIREQLNNNLTINKLVHSLIIMKTKDDEIKFSAVRDTDQAL